MTNISNIKWKLFSQPTLERNSSTRESRKSTKSTKVNLFLVERNEALASFFPFFCVYNHQKEGVKTIISIFSLLPCHWTTLPSGKIQAPVVAIFHHKFPRLTCQKILQITLKRQLFFITALLFFHKFRRLTCQHFL